MAIIIKLDKEGCAVNCSDASPSGLPKSTLSHHYKVLRESGLVWSERKGTEVFNTLRKEEIDRKFAGVLESILAAAQT